MTGPTTTNIGSANKPAVETLSMEAAPSGVLQSLSLRANFLWTFVGNVIYAGSQWGILILLAKLASPAAVGQFALGLAVTAPIIMLTNLQLRAVQATDARDDYRFGDYLGLRLVTTVLGIFLILGAILFADYGVATAVLIGIIGLAKSFESVSDIIYGLLQKHERMDRIALSMSMRGVLSLVGMGLVLWLTGSLVTATLALALVWLAMLLAYDLANARRMITPARPYFEARVLARLAQLALPLGIVMMLVSLTSTIPRYFIEHELGTTALGYFAAASYLMLAGTTVVGALGQAITPRMARSYANADAPAFVGLLVKAVALGAILGVSGFLVALLFGRQILAFLYRPDYAEQVQVFLWLMAVAGISYVASMLGYGMTAARRFKAQLPLFVAVVVVLTVACALLVPVYGLLGAAQAMAVATLVQVVGASAINWSAYRCIGRMAQDPGVP